MLLAALVRSGRNEADFSIPSALVSLVHVQDGVHCAREVYKRFLSLPSPNLRHFRHCIELKSNLAHSGLNDGLVNACKLYESALDLYKDDASLWRECYSFELNIRNIICGALYQIFVFAQLKPRLFRYCIELESNLAHSGIDDGLVNARKLYESALDLYKDDVSLCRVLFLELKAGLPKAANAVC